MLLIELFYIFQNIINNKKIILTSHLSPVCIAYWVADSVKSLEDVSRAANSQSLRANICSHPSPSAQTLIRFSP